MGGGLSVWKIPCPLPPIPPKQRSLTSHMFRSRGGGGEATIS